MELIKNKRIGKVLFIVEGGKHEFNLLKKIFVDVMGYTQIEKRRENARYYIRNAEKHSVIAVINTKTSNIESITDQEYLDSVFEKLIEIYDFDVDNAAIYYLFDRDPESNTDLGLITQLIGKLKNALENDDYTRGGMLLLSYPSVESYEVSCFQDESYKLSKKLGAEVKEYICSNAKLISMNKINETSIVHAGSEMKGYLELMGIELDLEDFSVTNEKVFHTEEQYLMEHSAFRLLSLLSCAFLDLGILKE